MTSNLIIQFVALVVTPSSLLLVIAFLGRSAVKQFLERNLEAHKNALTASTMREIENLKAELRQVAYEREVTFAKLHAERAEAVKELYAKARALGSAALNYAARKDVSTVEDHERNQRKVEEAASDLQQTLFDSRIFLSENLCVKIQDRYKYVINCATDVAGEWFPPIRSPEERWRMSQSNTSKLKEAVADLEHEIADEFRGLLGVGQERRNAA